MYTIANDGDSLNIRATLTSPDELEEFVGKLLDTSLGAQAKAKLVELSGPELAKLAELER